MCTNRNQMFTATVCDIRKYIIIMISEDDIEIIRQKLFASLKVLQIFDHLINAYAVDFFIENHWDKLPKSWQLYLQNISLENLSYLLEWEYDVNNKSRQVWPLSLLTLKTLFSFLCIKRQNSVKDSLQPCSLKRSKLKYVFVKGIKLKKIHELQYMAEVCKESFEKTPVDFIVDFGSGVGHLARLLGFCYGMKMCCLEKEAKLICQAEMFDAHVMKLIQKNITPTNLMDMYKPVHVRIQLDDQISLEELLNIIQNAMNIRNRNFTFGILGLHTCGDLAAILINLFLQCPQAKFLNLVGCCYMKLSTKDTAKQSQLYGFPLSKYMKSEEDLCQLSYEARAIACHAIEVYREHLKTKDCNFLKVHCFRAVTEYVLVKHYPHFRRIALKNAKYSNNMTFKDYFYKAVSKIPAILIPEYHLSAPIIQKYLSQWSQVVVFYTLRLFFAPLIESVVLYDRLLYLAENDCHVSIKAIFDGKLSPRNHITTAMKHF